jgi:hypothetical protein
MSQHRLASLSTGLTKYILVKVYKSLTPSSNNISRQLWISSTISLLWKYMCTLWSHWNTIVHGATSEEQANTLLKGLQTTTTDYYHQFQDNQSFLLPHHHYLFTDRTLEQCLHHSYDQLACWLRSVSEAH